MKNYIKTVVSLSVICALVAILLAVGNSITAPIIAENEKKAANSSLSVVMPNGEDFESFDFSALKLPDTINEVYSEKNGGYVFKITTTGYSSGLVIMCGVDKDGKVTGATCIASNETLGYEAEYGKNTVGKDIKTIDSVETISGATKTTEGYKNAVKDALNAFAIIGGESVDLRSEAEILADNLNKALPSAEGKFTKLFITESLKQIKAVYKADNNSGYVVSLLSSDKESFITADKDGNISGNSEISNELKTLINSSLTEIDIKNYADMPPQIQKAYKTSGGNYVFDLRAAGYGINGGNQWHPASGEYIYIKASVTADGTIIACETVSQKESEGIGDACADEKFYSQFSGKNEGNYSEIDAISGATITTDGYKTAVSKLFSAVKILKGE